MKRLTTFIIAAIISASTWAQSGLSVDSVFRGLIVAKNTPGFTETSLSGEVLRAYQLTKMRTINFLATEKQRNRVEQLVEEDYEAIQKTRTTLTDIDGEEREDRNGHIYYIIFRTADTYRSDAGVRKTVHTYVCYQCKPKGALHDITLVYLEGPAKFTDLMKNFKRKNNKNK
ncbi:MAG: DUF6108 family protein [Bacteroidaceae bacterium]|nr:DUF6108 family protein [Bacteroidaceae bacterium]